jgi:hypothetical protein
MSGLHPSKYRYIVNRLDQDWRVIDKIDARIIGASSRARSPATRPGR